MEHDPILLAWDGCLEGSLVHVGVEHLLFLARVESLETVFLEGLHQDRLGHLETVVKIDEIPGWARRFDIIFRNEFLWRDGG